MSVTEARRAGFHPHIYDVEERTAAVTLAKQLSEGSREAATFVVVLNGNPETKERARGRPYTIWVRTA